MYAAPAAFCHQSLRRPSRSNRSPKLPGPHIPHDPQCIGPTMPPGKATPRPEAGSLCWASCQLARPSCGARQRSNSGEAGSFGYAGDCQTPFAGAAIRAQGVEIEKICSGRSPTVGSPSRRSQRRRAELKRREMLPTTLSKAQWIGDQERTICGRSGGELKTRWKGRTTTESAKKSAAGPGRNWSHWKEFER
jgi:hypothetical protein